MVKSLKQSHTMIDLTAREHHIVSTVAAYGPMGYADLKALVGINGQEVTHLLYVGALHLTEDRYLVGRNGDPA